MSPVPADERRLQIITAAVEVITRAGAAKTTTRRVAAAADAPLASLHYIFKNKEELFTAVIEYILDLVDEELERHLESEDGLDAAVRALFDLNYDWCRKEPEFHIAEYELFIWALRTPSSSAFGRRIYERWFDVVGRVLAESAAGDDAWPPARIETLTRDVIASLDGMLLQMIAFGDNGPTREDARRYADAALASLRGTSGDGVAGPSSD